MIALSLLSALRTTVFHLIDTAVVWPAAIAAALLFALVFLAMRGAP